jgi:hypothetical protein
MGKKAFFFPRLFPQKKAFAEGIFPKAFSAEKGF